MINLYPNADMYPAMLISKQPAAPLFNTALNSGNFLGQVKKDGYWYQLEKTSNGEVYLFSRTKSKKTGCLSEKIDNVPHIKDWAIENLPNGTTLIGEIYYPGGKSNDTTKIMGCLPQTAVERQNNAAYGPIHYYIHDIIKHDNTKFVSLGFADRYKILYEQIDTCGLPYLQIAPVYENNLQEKLENIFNIGEEGMVFKRKDGLYVPGKRPTYNFKAKTECSFDAIITGFVEPEIAYTGTEIDTWQYWTTKNNVKIPVTKAYYYDWKAGFTIGALDNSGNVISIGRVSSGMTDELREDMAKNPEKYLNKVVELQAMSVNKEDLTLRHARLIRVREDKPAEDCKISDIF